MSASIQPTATLKLTFARRKQLCKSVKHLFLLQWDSPEDPYGGTIRPCSSGLPPCKNYVAESCRALVQMTPKAQARSHNAEGNKIAVMFPRTLQQYSTWLMA